MGDFATLSIASHLTRLTIACDDEDDWLRLFHGATLGKLESVSYPRFKQIRDFLGAFERAALSSSVLNTLSEFYLFTSCSWNPDYTSLLPFMQMVDLYITSSCDGGCSPRMDDDIVINLPRTMPKLEALKLGGDQVHHRCHDKGTRSPGLPLPEPLHPSYTLSSGQAISAPPASPRMTPNAEPTAL